MTRNTGPYLLLQWPLGGRFSIPALISIIQRPCESSLRFDQLNLLNPRSDSARIKRPKSPSHVAPCHPAEIGWALYPLLSDDESSGCLRWIQSLRWGGWSLEWPRCLQGVLYWKPYEIIWYWTSASLISHRIHGAAIYGNMDPINIPPMWAYMPYMDPMGLESGCLNIVQVFLVKLWNVMEKEVWHYIRINRNQRKSEELWDFGVSTDSLQNSTSSNISHRSRRCLLLQQ